MSDERQDELKAEEYIPPSWLQEAFAQSGTSPEFLRRCEESALSVLALTKLRREREKLGFVQVAFSAYVQGLAKLTGALLEPLLSRRGIVSLEECKNSGSLARLARELGFSDREASALLKVQVVEQSGLAPFPMVVAARKPAVPSDPLTECELTLASLAGSLPSEIVRELRSVDEGVRGAYVAES